jgi:hypothetical protein
VPQGPRQRPERAFRIGAAACISHSRRFVERGSSVPDFLLRRGRTYPPTPARLCCRFVRICSDLRDPGPDRGKTYPPTSETRLHNSVNPRDETQRST